MVRSAIFQSKRAGVVVSFGTEPPSKEGLQTVGYDEILSVNNISIKKEVEGQRPTPRD